MVNKKIKIVVIIAFFVFFGVLFQDEAHAVWSWGIRDWSGQDIIRDLIGFNGPYYWDNSAGKWRCYNGKHSPVFIFGDSCNGGICGNAVDPFKCISEGLSCVYDASQIGSIEVAPADAATVSSWRSVDGAVAYLPGHPDFYRYNYYVVALYPNPYWITTAYVENEDGSNNSDEFQTVQGLVYQWKKYWLTRYAIDEQGRRLGGVTNLSDDSTYAFYLGQATIGRNLTEAGFTPVYWIDELGNRPYGDANTSSYTTTMNSDKVVHAVYRAFSAKSSIDIKSKKSSASNYQDSVIYAKPVLDTINFRTAYNPAAQGGINLKPQRLSLNGSASWDIYTNLGQALSGWSNGFTVSGMGSNTAYYNYPNGNTSQRTEYNNYTVARSDVGNNFAETARLRNDSSKTPASIQIDLDGGDYAPSVARISTELSDAVNVIVPYNFDNTTKKPTKDPNDKDPDPDTPDDPDDPGDNQNGDEKIVYAGESDTFYFSVDVNPRDNPVTGGNYATMVKGAKWRIGLCIGKNDCERSSYRYSQEETGTLNEKGLLEGVKGSMLKVTANIPDIKAGSKICVRAEVWPANSGAFTNWEISKYPNSWAVSPRTCYTVAKRPSAQFWGGNVYSRGTLNTSTAVKAKKNLAGYTSLQSYSPAYVPNQEVAAFGTWGELGVVANGNVSGFGSGASMGYAGNDSEKITWPNYHPSDGLGNNTAPIPGGAGGSGQSSFCKRIPLSIPNDPCGGGIVFGLSSAVATTKAASDKESIVNLLASEGNPYNYTSSSEVNRAVVGDSIEGNTVRVISSDNDITISSDLEYLNGSYLRLSQMPKLIIYAKNNIYINCDVSRIDALLIANDTVVTCNNLGDVTNLKNESDKGKGELDRTISETINSSDNSNQLFINGAIIAKRLIANRTYGAASGANSVVPAEIVNFDPSLYQFSGSIESDDDTTGRLDMTYIHELPPRL